MKVELSERDIDNLIYVCLWVSREAEEGTLPNNTLEAMTDELSFLNTPTAISRANELLTNLQQGNKES